MGVRDSRLVRMAGEARRPSRWWLAWLIGLLLLHWVAPLGTWLGGILLDGPASRNALYPYVDGCAALTTLLGLWLWVRLKERRPFATVGFRPGRDWLRLLAGFVLGGGLVTVAVLLGFVLGVYGGARSTHSFSGVAAVLPLLPLIMLLLLQGVSYEAVTRGYMLQMGVRSTPIWVAIASTALLTSALQSLSPVALLNAVLYAVFASLLALRQGTLWLVAGMYAGWNCFQLNVFGLPVGAIPDPTAVWSFGPVPGTSDLLSGGPFGPASGLVTTFVLVPAVVVAAIWLRRATRAETAGETVPVTTIPSVPSPSTETFDWLSPDSLESPESFRKEHSDVAPRN